MHEIAKVIEHDWTDLSDLLRFGVYNLRLIRNPRSLIGIWIFDNGALIFNPIRKLMR